MKYLYLTVAILASACSNNTKPTQETQMPEAKQPAHDHGQESARDTTVILPGQKVFFENLKEGQEIKLPYIVKFGVAGMEVEPAMGVNPNKGHHHLLVDQAPVASGTMVPMDKEAEGYYHFGKGQLSDTLSLKKYPMLTPGVHKLRLQFANGLHQSYGSAMSSAVTVTIK